MTFANQKSVLIHDQKANIYNFYWYQNNIILKYYDIAKQRYDSGTLVEDSSLEFDAVVDSKNNLYVVIQKENGQLLLMSKKNSQWDTNDLSKNNQAEIFNLNLLSFHDRLHIIYCVRANESEAVYSIYHHFLVESGWKTLHVGDICRKNLLNPFQVIQTDNRIIITFYNLIDHEEQVFMKEFDTDKNLWKGAIQLTTSFKEKLYLDCVFGNQNILHLTYCEFFEGNLVVKYEKYKITDNRAINISESILSNPSNCSYPTFILTKELLWVCWTEYDQVVSCFSKNDGISWSNPLLWQESKGVDFFRHKFQTIDHNIQSYYQLNHAFGKGYPEYSFLGFGPTEGAVEMPLKNKKKEDELEENMDYRYKSSGIKVKNDKRQITNEINNEIKDDKKIEHENTDEIPKDRSDFEATDFREEIKKLEERIEAIEQYIQRRRRGIFFRSE